MSEYHQFTNEDSRPGSPSLLHAERSADCPPPYFPPTDEGNAQYTWGDGRACNQSVTSMIPIDVPRPPPYIDNDSPPPFNLQDTENGHPPTNNPTEDTSVIIQQPNGTEIPTVTTAPNDYLGWSICGCLCCVWSIGICAIMSSYDSRRAAYQGDMDNAKSSSLCALRLNVINMVFGVVLMTYCLLRFGLGV